MIYDFILPWKPHGRKCFNVLIYFLAIVHCVENVSSENWEHTCTRITYIYNFLKFLFLNSQNAKTRSSDLPGIDATDPE